MRSWSSRRWLLLSALLCGGPGLASADDAGAAAAPVSPGGPAAPVVPVDPSAPAAPPPATPVAPPPPAAADGSTPVPGGRRLADLVYGRASGRDLVLDLYLPAGERKRPAPLVVWVHGGGWIGGDKRPCPTAAMLPFGFATASVGYRLATEAVFPAQIEDVKAAVRWLRAHAATYRLDPDRFGAAGASAGGHLVALLGTAGDAADLEGTGGSPGVSSRVQAVLDVCGPTDFLQFHGRGAPVGPDTDGGLFDRLLGGRIHEKQDLARRANPIAYVSKDDPPFLLVHGARDTVVPLDQSRLLKEALDAAGVPADLVVVPDAGHDVVRPEVARAALAFFAKHLMPPTAPAPGAPAAPSPPPTTTPAPAGPSPVR